jgi:putative flippase GtrA
MWDRLDREKQKTIVQFVRFCVVGGSGVFVDMGITTLFVELVGLDPRLAAMFGFCVAVVSNFTLNRLWTFSDQAKTSRAFSFTGFLAICSVGMGISIGVMHLCMVYLGMAAYPWYYLARFIGIGVATVWNFAGSKYIAFK